MQIDGTTSDGERFHVTYSQDGCPWNGLVGGKRVSLLSNVACRSGISQPVIKVNSIILGWTRNNMAIILIIIAIDGFYMSVQSNKLPVEGVVRRRSIVVGIVRLPAGTFVGTRGVLVTSSIVVIRQVVAPAVVRTFVAVVSEFAAFATLILANVAALVRIVTVLAAMFAMTFPLLGSL